MSYGLKRQCSPHHRLDQRDRFGPGAISGRGRRGCDAQRREHSCPRLTLEFKHQTRLSGSVIWTAMKTNKHERNRNCTNRS